MGRTQSRPSGSSLGKSPTFYVLQLLTRNNRMRTIYLNYSNFSYFLASTDIIQTSEENRIFTNVIPLLTQHCENISGNLHHHYYAKKKTDSRFHLQIFISNAWQKE